MPVICAISRAVAAVNTPLQRQVFGFRSVRSVPGGPMPESRNSVQDIWGERTPFRGQGKWPERVPLPPPPLPPSLPPPLSSFPPPLPLPPLPSPPDYRVPEEPEQWIQSACVLCSNGCGIDIGVKQAGLLRFLKVITIRVSSELQGRNCCAG